MAPGIDIRSLLPEGMSASDLERALSVEIARVKRENRIDDYKPFPKQMAFHASGASHTERLFRAGNQLGKSYAGAAEATYHLTGRYPEWWCGRRFAGPTRAWLGGPSGESVREGPQVLLLGKVGEWGTGLIPMSTLIETTRQSGVQGLADTIRVRHVSGGVSELKVKSYEQGREKWQAATLDWIWFDEEPDLDLYIEGLTRTSTSGMTWLTFTPLKGMSSVVERFLMQSSKDRVETVMTIYDVPMTEDDRQRRIGQYPAHVREARTMGTPTVGSGLIFPVAETDITCDAIPIPPHWAQIGALDFGWDHPTAAVRLAWDRDNDVVYVTRTHRQKEATPAVHSAVLKSWGAELPWTWPHDGLQHDKGSGEQLAKQYRDHGLKMLPEHAQFPDGSNGVEAGLSDMLERMESGRFKVFRHLTEWFEEFRLYHRKDGRVFKQKDDLMAATRYGIMTKRFAKSGVKPERLKSADIVPFRAGGGAGWMV